jgi:DNA polymerase IV (DinB-like DNA polymerase)
MAKRIIAHLDMDAFFAAVEERDNPQFAGKPIVVGADPKGGKGRGVAATANYKARELGIRSATPISIAYRLAPGAIFLPPDFTKYKQVSQRIFKLLKKGTSLVEPVGIDEAYFDLSHLRSYKKAALFAKKVKTDIRGRENLTASVGIGPNKLIAKLASGKDKPDGLTAIEPKEVRQFLAPLAVQELPGVGSKTAALLGGEGVITVGDLRKFKQEKLVELVGSFGETLFQFSRGRDNRPIGEPQEPKSIGKQTTLEEDSNDARVITETTLSLALLVWKEALKENFPFEVVTVVVRYHDFETHTKSEKQKERIKDPTELKKVVLKLLLPFLGKKRIRLVGVRLSKN